jgi:hypothetical protein
VLRSLSPRGIVALAVLYAVSCLIFFTLEGTLKPGGLAPLFGNHPTDSLIPQEGDQPYEAQLRLGRLAFFGLLLAAMFVFATIQGLLPAVIGSLILTTVLQGIGNMSYRAFGVGGLALGVAFSLCGLALRWIGDPRTALFVVLVCGIGGLVYRGFLGDPLGSGWRHLLPPEDPETPAAPPQRSTPPSSRPTFGRRN